MRADMRTVLFAGRGPVFTPFDLGEALYDLWDAERDADLSLSGGGVAAWASAKHGYSAAQATSSARPVWLANAFNGRPGVSFDGIDDELTYEGVGLFPTGAAPCEIWWLGSQDAPASDTGVRYAFAYGGGGTSVNRALRRSVPFGNNAANANVGSGAVVTVASAPGNYDGRCVHRLVVGGTGSRVELNGAAGTTTVVVPATTAVRTRLGASTAAAAGGFLQGVTSVVAVTAPLSEPQALRMMAWLKARGGIG